MIGLELWPAGDKDRLNNEKSLIEWQLGETERHSVENIPPPDWIVYILCATDGSDVIPDLNQNWIGLFLSPNQLFHLILSQVIQNFSR